MNLTAKKTDELIFDTSYEAFDEEVIEASKKSPSWWTFGPTGARPAMP